MTSTRKIFVTVFLLVFSISHSYAQASKKSLEDLLEEYDRDRNTFTLFLITFRAKENQSLVVKWIEEKSKTDTQATIFAGKIHRELKDGKRAIQFFESAWNRGEVSAASELADFYLDSSFIEQSKKLSCEWRKRLIEKNPNTTEATEYGICLDTSMATIPGFAQSQAMACDWYRRGAEMYFETHDTAKSYPSLSFNNGRAYVLYSMCLSEKEYGSLDLKKSGIWAMRSMELSHPYGTYFYASKLLDGSGVLQSNTDGMKYMNKAAELGSSIAQNSMGVIYAEGKITQKNISEAYKWFVIAQGNGYENAKANKSNAEKLLTPSEINQSQIKAKQWQSKYIDK